MAELFGYEKLTVYRKGMAFAAIRSSLLDGLRRRVAACLDVFVAKKLSANHDVYPGKSLLAEIVSMLIAMRKAAAKASAEPSQVEDGRAMLRCIAAMLTSLSKVVSHDA